MTMCACVENENFHLNSKDNINFAKIKNKLNLKGKRKKEKKDRKVFSVDSKKKFEITTDSQQINYFQSLSSNTIL